MFKAILAIGTTAVVASSAMADLLDPIELRTHEVFSTVSWNNQTSSQHYTFDPASIEDECAHTQLWAPGTEMHVSNYCADADSEFDVVRFDWKNYHGRDIASSAVGTASSKFSTISDGELSLASINNFAYLAAHSNWSISLFDEDSNHLGDLGHTEASISILGNTQYNLVFNIDGWNTLTFYGRMVSWNVQMAYSSEDTGDGSHVVPGFGGLALLGGITTLRRRRRR